MCQNWQLFYDCIILHSSESIPHVRGEQQLLERLFRLMRHDVVAPIADAVQRLHGNGGLAQQLGHRKAVRNFIIIDEDDRCQSRFTGCGIAAWR